MDEEINFVSMLLLPYDIHKKSFQIEKLKDKCLFYIWSIFIIMKLHISNEGNNRG